MKYYTKQQHTGSGVINTLINKLPFELHLPGYNYCGPGTKLSERLERGDKGVNMLDEACKEHDIAYSERKDLSDRHEADKTLLKAALSRTTSNDASWKEKLAALGVSAAMHTKLKLGMGLNKLTHKNKICSFKSEHQQSSKIIEQIIKSMQVYLRKMELLKDKHRKLLQQNSKNTITKKQSKQKKIVRVKLDRSKNQKFKVKKSKWYDNDDNDDDFNKSQNQELHIDNYEKKIQHKIKGNDNVQSKQKYEEALTEINKKGKKRRISDNDDDHDINRRKPKIQNENVSTLLLQGSKRKLNDADNDTKKNINKKAKIISLKRTYDAEVHDNDDDDENNYVKRTKYI